MDALFLLILLLNERVDMSCRNIVEEEKVHVQVLDRKHHNHPVKHRLDLSCTANIVSMEPW